MAREMREVEAKECWCPRADDADQKCQGRGCALWVPRGYVYDPSDVIGEETFWRPAWCDESFHAEPTGNTRERDYQQQLPHQFLRWLFRRPRYIKKFVPEKEWKRVHIGRCGAFGSNT